MTLAEQLTETVGAVRSAVPAVAFDAIEQSIADLDASRIANRAASVGERPRLMALPDARGVPVDLAALLTQGPLVVTFYRGGWCPYCNVTLAALQRQLPEIHALGAQLVAITPETPERIGTTSERAKAGFPILRDASNAFARTLGLVFVLPETLRPLYEDLGIDLPAHNGERTFSLPVPATYVVARDGRIAWSFVDADFTRRAEPHDVVAALRALS